MKCPFCDSTDLAKREARKLRRGRVQYYFCRKCRRKFARDRQLANKMKTPRKIVVAAMEMFEYMSLRDVSKAIKDRFGWDVSSTSIRNWVSVYYKDKTNVSSSGYIPCYRCLFIESLKARACRPEECLGLEMFLQKS